MKVIINESEIMKLIRENIDTPRNFEVKNVEIQVDMNEPFSEDSVSANITLEEY